MTKQIHYLKSFLIFSGFSNLIVTCQEEEIRVWNMSTKKEILRHVVANMTCNAVCITRDGKTIISGRF